jgi:hypothetical protein
MRHAEVSYVRDDGGPVNPLEVSLNDEGSKPARPPTCSPASRSTSC